MSCGWDALQDILAEMVQVHQEILAMARHKQEALQGCNIQELKSVMQQEEVLIFQTVKLNGAYEKILREFADLYGFRVKRPKAKDVIQLADQETQDKLEGMLQEFVQLTASIKQVNEMNQRLIDQTLVFVKYNINLLTQNAADSTYVSLGQAASGLRNRAMFDNKA